MREMLEYFRGESRRTWLVLVGGLVLCTIYLYPGHHTTIRAHLPAGPYQDWLAQGYQFLAAFLLLFVAPLVAIKVWLKEDLGAYGLALGDWRFGLAFAFVAMVALVGPTYITAGDPAFQAEYPLAGSVVGQSAMVLLAWEMSYLVYYIAWEFFFRGFMLMGLRERLGPMVAIAVQTIPSTIMHIGKPLGETAAAIVGGLIFGAVALRTRSILYVLLVHWYLGALTDILCLWRSGALGPH